jgi:hypothetical protein
VGLNKKISICNSCDFNINYSTGKLNYIPPKYEEEIDEETGKLNPKQDPI